MRAANSGNHFVMIEDSRAHHCQGEPNSNSLVTTTAECREEEPETSGFFGNIFVFPQGALETFIGLSVAPGYALIDTGAQHGVLGPSSYNHICNVLARFGLKP